MKRFRSRLTIPLVLIAWVGGSLGFHSALADVARTVGGSSSGGAIGGTVGSPIIITNQGAAATIGSNLITNGTFTGSATGWTLGLGGGAPDWAYSSNTVTHANGGGTTALEPSTPLTVVAGSRYVVLFAVTNYVAGTITPSIGGTSGGAVSFNTAGFTSNSWYEVITATNTTNFKLTPSTTLDATIDSVEVYQVTALKASSFSIANGAATYQVEFRTSTSGNGSFWIGDDGGEVGGVSSGTFNLGIGVNALKAVTFGSFNQAFGTSALLTATSGSGNNAFGTSALRLLRVGGGNNAFGFEALKNMLGGAENLAFGNSAAISLPSGTGNVCLGSASCAGSTAISYTLALGYGASPTTSNQGVIGGNSASAGITALYVGSGVTKASPSGITILGTGGSGADNAGSSLTLAPGAPTGTGLSALNLQRNLTSTTSSTAQTQVPGMTICPRKILSNTSATAQTIAIIDLASNSAAGGEAHITVTCSDGTNFDAETQSATFSFVNKATALTISTPVITASSAANNSGSCTIGFTAVAGTNQVLLKVTPVFTTIVPTIVYSYAEILTHQPSTTAVACQ